MSIIHYEQRSYQLICSSQCNYSFNGQIRFEYLTDKFDGRWKYSFLILFLTKKQYFLLSFPRFWRKLKINIWKCKLDFNFSNFYFYTFFHVLCFTWFFFFINLCWFFSFRFPEKFIFLSCFWIWIMFKDERTCISMKT